MTITLRGNASNTVAGAGDVTVTLPGGMAENDIVIAAYMSNSVFDEDMAMTTSGYTELADLRANDSNDTNLGVFRKRMGGTPDSTAVFAGVGGGLDASAAAVEVLIGVDTTTSEDAATTTATGTNSAAVDNPSITTVTDDAWVVAVGACTEDDIPTAPSGYGDLIEDQRTEFGFTSNIMIATKEITSAGAEDPGVFGGITGDTGDSWCAATVALRPAVVAAANRLLLINPPGLDGGFGTGLSL